MSLWKKIIDKENGERLLAEFYYTRTRQCFTELTGGWFKAGKGKSFCAWLLETVVPESTSMFKERLTKFVDNRLIKWVLKRTQGGTAACYSSEGRKVPPEEDLGAMVHDAAYLALFWSVVCDRKLVVAGLNVT